MVSRCKQKRAKKGHPISPVLETEGNKSTPRRKTSTYRHSDMPVKSFPAGRT
jgi:hypothetical protein